VTKKFRKILEKKSQEDTGKVDVVNEFLTFSRSSPSQFHVVASAISLLKKAGFKEISEKDDEAFENIAPNQKFYFTRNQSALIAFSVGGAYKTGNGFIIAGAHTDSPVLKVKPVSKTTSQDYEQVGVETYGGGLWYSWFDKDLSIAGRVIVEEKGKFISKLVNIEKPILKIPSLAIHLNRDIYTEGFKPNSQTHLLPLIATTLNSSEKSKKEKDEKEKKEDRHHNILYKLLSEKLNIERDQIKEFELTVYDTQPATLGGALDEFVFARGLDNQLMSYVSTRALIDSSEKLEKQKQIHMVCLFDNEEIGSQSFYGADSSLIPDVLARLNNDSKTYNSAIRKSFLLSADMAHAVHPNYPEKHENQHRPKMHQGLVIKTNVSQRYTTTPVTSFLLEEIAKRHNIPIQRFVARNDMPCGTTIGPILSSKSSIRGVDIGIPQLSMHSIREMCGIEDIRTSTQLLQYFFEEFYELDSSVIVD